MTTGEKRGRGRENRRRGAQWCRERGCWDMESTAVLEFVCRQCTIMELCLYFKCRSDVEKKYSWSFPCQREKGKGQKESRSSTCWILSCSRHFSGEHRHVNAAHLVFSEQKFPVMPHLTVFAQSKARHGKCWWLVWLQKICVGLDNKLTKMQKTGRETRRGRGRGRQWIRLFN